MKHTPQVTQRNGEDRASKPLSLPVLKVDRRSVSINTIHESENTPDCQLNEDKIKHNVHDLVATLKNQ